MDFVQSYSTSLVIQRQLISGLNGLRVTVNNTSPGPVLRIQGGDTAYIKIINDIFDDSSAMHWHGFLQKRTPFSDGVIGLTQCPITNAKGFNHMTYQFETPSYGTFWYHGHFNEQYPDGQIGGIVISSPQERSLLNSVGVTYDYDIDDFVWIAADYYAASATSLIPQYLSPESNGNEPIPDAYIINGKLSGNVSIVANKNKLYRVRVINGAAFSMFTISVDGMPLKIIEIDGGLVKPLVVSNFTVNVAQRVSFILDFSKLDSSLQSSPSIWFRFTGMPTMYASYNASDPNLGLYGE